jgi:hypothetical protein
MRLLLLLAGVACFVFTAFDWFRNDTVTWWYLGWAFVVAAFAVGEKLPQRK